MNSERDGNPLSSQRVLTEQSDLGDSQGLIACWSRPPRAGADWWVQGWRQFKKAPGQWIGAWLLFLIITIVVGLLPLVGLLAVVVQTILIGGLCIGCRDADGGKPFKVSHLFAGFQSHTKPLALIGFYYALGIFMYFLILGILIGMMGLSLEFNRWWTGTIVPGALVLGFFMMIVTVVVVTVLTSAYWFAPVLVVRYGVSAGLAMKMSVIACWRNVGSMLIYSLIGVGLMLICGVTLGLAILVVGPVAIASLYAGAVDIFAPV